MTFLKKNPKIRILLFSLVCTIIIFNLNKKSNLSSFSLQKLTFSLRNLIDINQKVVEERCKKATKEFLNKYNESISNLDLKEPDKYQKILIEMIDNKKLEFSYIKKYLPRLLIYLIFLIVDLIIIILWLVLCGQCCCGKKYKEQKTGCSKFVFFLFFFFNVISILICVYGFIISPSFYKSINAVVCSLYKLVFHFTEGINNDYPDYYWKGFEGINSLLEQYNETFSDIIYLKLDCNGTEEECIAYQNIAVELKKQTNELKETLEKASEKIELVSEPINDIKNNTLDEIEEIVEKFDKFGKIGLYGLFVIIALFCLLSLLTLTAYFVCGCSCISCLFHLIWNIQMIIIIVIILVGICFGTLGKVSIDLVTILNFAKSEANINSDDPSLLKFNKEYLNITNQCLNKNGDLYTFALGEEEINFYEEINNLSEEFDKNYNKFQKTHPNLQNDLSENLRQIFDDLLNLNNNLNIKELANFFNCSFFQKDFNVLLREIKETMAKKLSFMSLVVIVPVLVTFLTIVIGVLLVSNYTSEVENIGSETHDRHSKSKSRSSKNDMDSSSDNLRK